MVSLAERSPLAGTMVPGHYGRDGSNGVVIEEVTGLAFASVICKREKHFALINAVTRQVEAVAFNYDKATWKALDKETAFVVAVALFRKPSGLSWRSIYELPEKKCSLFGKPLSVGRRFTLEDYRIEGASNP